MMTTGQELAIREGSTVSPAMFEQAMSEAVAKAKIFTGIVEKQKLYTQMGQGKHLHVEAWLTMAEGYGLSAGVESDEILYDSEGIEIGGRARAIVMDRLGTIIGRATGYCMRSEMTWRTKPIHQLTSMAGTRAVSKALSLKLRWVVVLAGYSPTPLEEMETPQTSNEPRRRPGRPPKIPICPTHDAPYNEGAAPRQYHMVGDLYCVRTEGLLDSEGNSVTEGEIIEMPDEGATNGDHSND